MRRGDEMKIIDISHHNGAVDLKSIKESGIDGVIIRAGYGRLISQKDKMFENNYRNAFQAGLHIGAYWYSYAKDPSEAQLEASVFLDAIKGKKFDLPVYFDIEEPAQAKLGKTACSEIADAFCSEMEKAGYFCGIYSFDSFFTADLSEDISRKYSCWIARIGTKPVNHWDMWQYSWTEKFPENNCSFDISECCKDFPEIIKKSGLNGYKNTDTYSVKAEINNISLSEADKIRSICIEAGMNVTQEKERIYE